MKLKDITSFNDLCGFLESHPRKFYADKVRKICTNNGWRMVARPECDLQSFCICEDDKCAVYYTRQSERFPRCVVEISSHHIPRLVRHIVYTGNINSDAIIKAWEQQQEIPFREFAGKALVGSLINNPNSIYSEIDADFTETEITEAVDDIFSNYMNRNNIK